MKGTLLFDYAHLLYYEWHKINLNCGGLHTHDYTPMTTPP